MKISKISFKDGQAWLSIYSEDGDYLGTWHVISAELVEQLRLNLPKEIHFGEKNG